MLCQILENNAVKMAKSKLCDRSQVVALVFVRLGVNAYRRSGMPKQSLILADRDTPFHAIVHRLTAKGRTQISSELSVPLYVASEATMHCSKMQPQAMLQSRLSGKDPIVSFPLALRSPQAPQS